MSEPTGRDVVVLGGGVAGLSMAWHLLRLGARVEVVTGSEPQASMVAAGMLAPMAEGGINPSLGRLAVEALRSYPGFLEELAEDTDLPAGFQRNGLLRVAYSEAEALAIREQVGAYESAGMPSRWLDARGCLGIAPGLGEAELRGGLLSYDEAQVQPDWMLAALRDAVVRRGGAFREAEASGVTSRPSGVVVRLRTESGIEELVADQVVVAMGSWSGSLPGATMSVRPVKGQLLAFEGSPGPAQILYWGHHYLLTKPDATVVLGATMEEAGFSTAVDEKGEALREMLDRFWPALSSAPAAGSAGLRPAAVDGLPLVGWVRPRTIYAFTAHFRNGFLLAPMTAKLAAREVTGGSDEEMLRRLRPGRLSAAGPASSQPAVG